MSKLKSGDSITCRISAAEIVSPSKTYDEVISFTIVAVDEQGYFLFVPNYLFIKNTMIADKYRCKKLSIEERFLGEEIVYILDNMVTSVERKQEGLRCRNCCELFPYASPNQADGKTLICFSCRGNPYRWGFTRKL